MRILRVLIAVLFPLTVLAQPQPTTADARLAGYQRRLALQDHSLIRNVKFQSIGPSVCSGRVTDIDADPEDPSHFYVAYASGGLWYTDNDGAGFVPVFDHEAAMSIGDIAVDWRHGIIWVGTGENNSSRSSYSGVGIYRSADGGKTWSQRGLKESQHVGRILTDPGDSNTIWVAVLGSLYSPGTDRGVYKTSDGGMTWRKTLYVNENAGAIDLVQVPDNPHVLYAATWERTRRAWNFTESGAGSGIYRSDDGGEHWQLLTTAESGFPTGDGVGRIGLTVGATPDGYLIYAVVDNYNRRPPKPAKEGVLTKSDLRTMPATDFLKLKPEEVTAFLQDNGFPEKYTADTIFTLIRSGSITPLTLVQYLEDANSLLFDTDVIGAEVYVSEDKGRSWKKTHSGYLDDVYYTYGYYFGQIRVSPEDVHKLYLLGVPALRSVDGGATWKSIDGDNVHGDHHALWLDPSRDKHLILGNDGGINVTYDDGGHWFKCNSPAVGQCYSAVTDRATPYNVYGGLQDNGVWGGPFNADTGTSWQSSGDYPYDMIFGGDGMQVQVDYRDNNTVYAGFQFGNYARINKATGEWKFITPQHDLTERPYRWNWQAPIWLSRHQQDILYMGSQFVHRSLDQGAHFEIISGDLTKGGRKGDIPYGTLTTIHESPLEFGVIYTGSDDGLVYATRDFGNSWQRISDGLPQDLWVSRVRASAHQKSRVYVALNGYRWDDFTPYLYVSEDYGTSWKRIGQTLPDEPINVIIEDPHNENLLYVGTDGGLYISLDRGNSFMAAGNSLPSVAVHDLDVQPVENDLLVGTHGRSFYRADVAQIELLSDTLLAKKISAFAIPASGMRASARWGTRSADWQEYRTPEITLPLYCKTSGSAAVKVVFADQTVYHKTFQVDNGLNFLAYDLSVDTSLKDDYMKAYTAKHEDATVTDADNGVMYLRKGVYQIMFSKDGAETSQDFELK